MKGSHTIKVEIPAENVGQVADAFMSGDGSPYAFDALGGEEFRRIIGCVWEFDVVTDEDIRNEAGEVVTPAGTVLHRAGDVDFDSPVDLDKISQVERLALAAACVRAYVRTVIAAAAVREAQAAAVADAADAGAFLS